MMSRFALLIGGPVWVAASIIGGVPASAAQCRLCDGKPGVLGEEDGAAPIELEVESGLKFDSLVLVGAGDGAAILNPDGTRVVTGSLTGFNGTALVGNAVVRGEPGRLIRIELPRIIELHSLTGSQLLIDDLVTDLPTTARLDSSGRLNFRFGGRLKVNGEADGDYRGDLLITADYL